MLPSLWSLSTGGTRLSSTGTSVRANRRRTNIPGISPVSSKAYVRPTRSNARSYATSRGATVEGTKRFFDQERQEKRLALLNSSPSSSSSTPTSSPSGDATPSTRTLHSPIFKPKVNKKTGWTMGPFGMGTYRMSLQSMEHQEAIEVALQTGATNVIDTSPNYGQEAEALVGLSLHRLMEAERISRDEIIVIDKVGPLVSGGALDPVKRRAAKGRPFQGMTLLSSDLGYCLDPDYIDYQITTSLKALELDVIDLLLIDTPEVVLPENPSEAIMAQLYRMMQTAMGYLEQEVKRGRIQYYGLASSSMGAFHRQENPRLSFDMIHRTAHTLGETNHFAAVSYPLNMLEPHYAHNDLTMTQTTTPHYWSKQGRDASLQLQAFQAGLIQLGHRPLNTLIETADIFTHIPKPGASIEPNGLMYRLASVPSHDGATLAPIIKATINSCVALEKGYSLEYNKYKQYPPPQTAQQNSGEPTPEMPTPNEFMWTLICISNFSRLDLETFKVSWQQQMQPAIKSSVAKLRKARPEMEIWAINYERGMDNFSKQYQEVLETNKAQELRELMESLEKSCPSLDNPSISARAVRAASSTLVTTCLIGMRKPEYVKDITYGGGSAEDPKSMLPIDPSFLGNIFDTGSIHVDSIRKAIRSQLALEEEASVASRQEEAEDRIMAAHTGPIRPKSDGGKPQQ